MGNQTGISWANRTWNPWKGCKHVSKGCANCYMFRDMRRWGMDPKIVTRCKTWGHPHKWNKLATTQLVFTCSWSDFFIDAADSWRDEAWQVIKACPWLQFQILTKRIERVVDHLPSDWGQEGYPNVWLGTSIEDDAVLNRADILRQIPARIRFISAEPLLGSLANLDLTGIHWLIAGGESGPDFRPMKAEWALELRDLCRRFGVAYFYKQGASFSPGKNDKLNGTEYKEFPLQLVSTPEMESVQ